VSIDQRWPSDRVTESVAVEARVTAPRRATKVAPGGGAPPAGGLAISGPIGFSGAVAFVVGSVSRKSISGAFPV